MVFPIIEKVKPDIKDVIFHRYSDNPNIESPRISQRAHIFEKFESHVNLPPNMRSDSLDSLDKFTQEHDDSLQYQFNKEQLSAGERYARYRDSVAHLKNQKENESVSRNQFIRENNSARYSNIITPRSSARITYNSNAIHNLDSIENKISDSMMINKDGSLTLR